MVKMTDNRFHLPIALIVYYVAFAAMAKFGSIGVYLAWCLLILSLGYSFFTCTKSMIKTQRVPVRDPYFIHLNS